MMLLGGIPTGSKLHADAAQGLNLLFDVRVISPFSQTQVPINFKPAHLKQIETVEAV
jgi:hypothetical protein